MATPTSEQRRGAGKAQPLTPEEEAARQRLKRIWTEFSGATGTTQRQLAHDLGVNPSLISQYFNGFIPLNVQFVMRLADKFKVPPSDIMPDKANLFAMAASGNQLKVFAIFSKDGGKRMLMTPTDVGGWMSPSPTAKAIELQRDMFDRSCPSGSIIVFETAKNLDHYHVMANSRNLFVLKTRNAREELFIVTVDKANERLIDTDTGEELVKATSELTDKYFVYPVIAKMCLTGVG